MYDDFVHRYDYLMARSAEVSYDEQRRLLTLTNLPDWLDVSEEAHLRSDLLERFHATYNASMYTPRNLEIFLTLRFISRLAQSTSPINADNLRRSLYLEGLFVVDETPLGTFNDCASIPEDLVGTSCTKKNYGASDIKVISMAAVLNKTVAAVYGPVTPSMDFTLPNPETGLTTGQIAGIIAGGGALLVLIAVILIVIFCCCLDSRDNKNAPKKLEEPVTLIFTDIESSTALWAAAPQLMPDAVATHHKLIRQLIQKYKCYEVKTIGDSFMIACKEAFVAVQLAQELQRRFLKHDWGTHEIDECYHAFENRKADDIPDYEPPTANLSPDVYSALWNGLRVRVGIHTGLSDIRCDDVTGGYDYYGETSNMAARTEAIGNGGQVVMTESTWWALSDAEREQLRCTNLNSQALRGVPFNVEMYQLDSVEGRRYANLRTEIDAILPDDGLDDGASNSDATGALLSMAGTLTGPSAAVSTVLLSCFSPYPPQERIRQIQPLLQKWSIPVPPRNRRIPEDDYCRGLINRLSVKMASVAQIRLMANGTGPNSAHGTPSVRSCESGGLKTNALLDTLLYTNLRDAATPKFLNTNSPTKESQNAAWLAQTKNVVLSPHQNNSHRQSAVSTVYID
ncbi:Adenylate and Guanylate cyclase catalytic domain containing protein, putative [Angomonas deanei]|uniref:adenylate cyclase n=1 Tax=Angomonas deanei TaxID=59799 RepID=A0A7G2CRJ1_9TRYP|nr:Adenylate and Guanylate cyclase catalytic domain containing protein, putative [Angomonas deanei]